MNIRRRNKLTSEVSVASLNDIMFFLLLFFLIASTLVSPNVIKLLLPSAKSGKAVSKQTITITVSSDLQYFVNSKQVAFSDMEPELTAASAGIDEPTIILKVDRSVQVQNLVDLLDLGNRLKLKMILATATSPK